MNIGRYEIQEEIGRGGMATVYLAVDPRFKRTVAIKVLPRELLHNPLFQARFEREAQTVAALEHPAIVPVHDYGEQGGQPFLVMRYMSGGSLADKLNKGLMGLTEAARILSRLAGALDSAHSMGVVHRDLKPANILFDRWGEPYLSDFGIAKLLEAGAATLTGTGALIGTPAYISPEQVLGNRELDGRSDVYALGVIFYEMISGTKPFSGDTPMGLAFKHVNAPIPRVLEAMPSLEPECQSVIERAMAKEPADRFASAAAMAAAVTEITQEAETLETPSDPGPVDDYPATQIAFPEPGLAPASAEEQGPETEIETQVAEDVRPAVDDWPVTKIEAQPARESDTPVFKDVAAATEVVPPQPSARPVPRAIPEPVSAPAKRSRSPLVWLLPVAGVLTVIVLCAAAAFLIGPRLLDEDPTPTTAVKAAAEVIGAFIDENWANGYEIDQLAYGPDEWLVVMSQGEMELTQSVQRDAEFPADFVDQMWADGFEIGQLAYGGGQWAVVMSRGGGALQQTLQRDGEFPADFVDEMWAEGFEISQVAYGGGQWAVVVSSGGGALQQTLQRDREFPAAFVDEMWAEGFEISQLAYGDGQWVVVMSAGGEALQQTLQRDAEFPSAFVDEMWAEGFEISEVAYGGGQWVVVMSAGGRDLRQTLLSGRW